MNPVNGADSEEWLSNPEAIDLMGLKVHLIDRAGCIAYFEQRVAARLGGWIITPNLDHLRRAVGDPELAAMNARCQLSVADGTPLVWGSRILGTPLPARVAGSDLIWDLSGAAARIGLPVILLGGDPGTAEKAARVLQARYPELQVAGCLCPPRGFENDSSEMARIRQMLGRVPRALVFVALGAPKQELLADRLRTDFPGHWWIGIGISLSFVCGEVSRAPRWVQRIGAEWIHRLVQEPGRLAKRYLLQGIPFAARFLGWCLIARVFPKGRQSRDKAGSDPAG